MVARQSKTNPLIALLFVVISTGLAILLVPNDHRPGGALFLPALVMIAGLTIPPIITSLRYPGLVFRSEHLLMAGLAYWILLDLAQGAYDLRDVGRTAVLCGLG